MTDHVYSNLLIYGRIEHCINAEYPEHQYNNHEIEKVADYTGSTMSGIWARFVLPRYLYVRLGSVLVRCYGTTKFFVLKIHGLHDKITILLN